MQTIGCKIIDRNEPLIEEIVRHTQTLLTPIEVGLYVGDPAMVAFLVDSLKGLLVNTHLNHTVYNFSNLEEFTDRFKEEILYSKRLGADYGIQHLSFSPLSPTRIEASITKWMDNILIAEEICEKENFDVYIENTYNRIEMHEALFESIKKRGLKHMNFCFDIGHAKVWSESSFNEWLIFLDTLVEEGFKLHFHLHANFGLRDDHLSLIEAKERGCFEGDGVFAQKNYLDLIYTLNKKYPQSRKVFEVMPQTAIENLNLVLDYVKKDLS